MGVKMAVIMENLSPSQEFSLDTQIEGLVGKVADGIATDGDRAALAQLSSSRVRLMRRILVHGGSKRAA